MDSCEADHGDNQESEGAYEWCLLLKKPWDESNVDHRKWVWEALQTVIYVEIAFVVLAVVHDQVDCEAWHRPKVASSEQVGLRLYVPVGGLSLRFIILK